MFLIATHFFFNKIQQHAFDILKRNSLPMLHFLCISHNFYRQPLKFYSGTEDKTFGQKQSAAKQPPRIVFSRNEINRFSHVRCGSAARSFVRFLLIFALVSSRPVSATFVLSTKASNGPRQLLSSGNGQRHVLFPAVNKSEQNAPR